jgi:uncharacterized membrane protein YedE/YeeE
MELLLDRPAPYLVGTLLGLVVVGLAATLNERLGVIGGYSEVVERASGRARSLGWRGYFLFGIIGGALLFALVSGGWRAHGGYGWLGEQVGDGGTAVLLLFGGSLVGFGAKVAGGCTSGHGLSGCSFGNPASFVSTTTFMATGIGTAFAMRWLLGAL